MNILPLTHAQQRIWLEWNLTPSSPAYNNPLLYELEGALDSVCLEKALQHIVTEQPALRSYFITQGGLPKQIIETSCLMTLAKHDVSGLSSAEKLGQIARLIDENVKQPFDLTQLPLFRFSLIKTDHNKHLFVLNIHHIVVDGYSAKLLIQHISDYYLHFLSHKERQYKALDTLYQTYNEESQCEAVDSSEAIQFWQTQFQDATMRVDLFQTNTQALTYDEGIRSHFSISEELTQQLKLLAKQHKTTEFIILMAAFYIVLSKYANQEDLTLGYPLDIRPVSCRELFGFFVNNIPMRLVISPNDSFAEIVQRMNQKRKEIKAYQKTDLGRIIRYVRMLYPSHPDSLYNISFIRANFALQGLQFPHVKVTAIPIATGSVKDELCLLYDESGCFEFELEYNKQFFSAEYIEAIKGSYLACLQAIVSSEQRLIGELDIFQGVNTSHSVEHNTLLADNFLTRFLTNTQQSPQQIAIVTSHQTLSYQALYQKVMTCCDHLEQLGVDGKPVIVCLDRTPTLIVVLLALQWLDSAYVPVDSTIAPERLRLIQADCQASAIICEETTLNMFEDMPCQVISGCMLINTRDDFKARLPSKQHAVAYIIYTSGSTGTPKGVIISKWALNNFLQSMAGYFLNEDQAMMLALTTIAFDIAGLELYLPLWQGKSVFLADEEQRKDPVAIASLLQQHPITHMQATPALWQMLLEMGWAGNGNLIALCGGDALTKALAKPLIANVMQLWNMYGPTEATIWCSLKQITNPDEITVGRPINHMAMHVLDSNFRVLPPFVKGELYISGIGLAEGYVNNEALTHRQFISENNPLGRPIYRAGDIACVNHQGEFILFGRKDNQIKYNGYRIELGEIEARLKEISTIQECAVLLQNQQLVAYVCIKPEVVFSQDEIQQQLARFLPEYMLPKQYVLLSHFPLSISGKIDKKALPIPELQQLQQVKPENNTEQRLLEIWQSVMQNQAMGVTDHFYSVGGHSLLAIQLLIQINTQFKTALSLAQLLAAPTIRLQSQLVQKPGISTHTSIPTTDLTCIPLTQALRRIWFVSNLSHQVGQFHMAAQLSIHGQFNLARFKHAANCLALRHEPLRMVIRLIDHEPYQNLLDDFTLNITPLSSGDETTIRQWALQPFDFFNQPLWRIGFYQTQSDETIVVLCLHHLIADGYSVSLFLNELWAVYETGEPLPPLSTRYIDYAQAENNQSEPADDLLFWRQELLNCPYLQLPHDVIATDKQLGQGDVFISAIDEQQWHEIQRFCQQLQLSWGGFLTAAFGLLLQRYSKQTDFCIGMPYANRGFDAQSNLIGCLMDLIPIRIAITQQTRYADWVKQIDHYLKLCLSHHGIAFSSLINHLQLERNGIESPLFPVVLNIQQDPFNHQYTQELDITVSPINTHTSKYDLSLEIYFDNDKASCRWEFATHLFHPSTIEDMAVHFNAVIHQLLQLPNQTIEYEKGITEQVLQAIPQKQTVAALPYREPQTAMQKLVAESWKKILPVKQVGLDDHFFRLGGHSFLAARLISDLSEKLGYTVSIELIFKHSNFYDFCAALLQAEPTVKPVSVAHDFERSQLPLTPNQVEMALLYKENQDALYHISLLVTIDDGFNIPLFERALNDTLKSHSIYRWQLSKHHIEALLAPFNPVVIQTIPLNDTSLVAAAEAQNQLPIALHQAPLIKVDCFKGDENALLFRMHHIIGDEWALHGLIQAAFERYQNPNYSIPSSSWENQFDDWLSPEAGSLAFWQHYLQNAIHSRIEPTRGGDSQNLGQYTQSIDVNSVNLGHQFARAYDATFYHVSLAVFIQLIRSMTQDEQLMFGVTYDRRNNPERQVLQGYLVNMLPLVVPDDLSDELPVLIQWVKTNNLLFLQNGDVDYSQLMKEGWVTKPEIVFNYQNTHTLKKDAKVLSWQGITSNKARFSLVIHLRQLEDGCLSISVDYHAGKYHASFAKAIVKNYISLFQHAFGESVTRLKPPQLAIYNNEDKIPLFNAHQFHSKPAIDYQGEILSYANMWQEAELIATSMLQLTKRTSLEQEVIAIALNNKKQQILIMLASLLTGAAFLSIELTLPVERQRYLLEESRATLIVYDTDLVLLDRDQRFVTLQALYNHKSTPIPLPNQLAGTLPAYVIFTSGSTGLPKGVMISRQGLFQFVQALQKQLGIVEQDKVLQFSSLSFDASIWEIFLSIYAGATLIIPDENQRRVGQSLQSFMLSKAITHAILTPSVLNTLDPSLLPALRAVASGGEACSRSLVNKWTPYCQFYNAYGPTEGTVCVALANYLPDMKATVIGDALGLAKLWIASPNLDVLPIGAIGELLIGGPILALGYINQDELTKQRFIWIDGQRWYRTGDRVRQINDKQFEYLGRLDRQVKLHGIRIELGEVESALLTLAGIRATHCIIDDNQLIAYVIADNEVSHATIMSQLSLLIPRHALPNCIIPLTVFPMLPSGKINVKQLPKPDRVTPAFTLPRTETEQQLHRLWSNTLKHQAVDVLLDFFSMGGNSLQAMEISSAIAEHFQIDFSTQLFYSHPSIAAQSAYIISAIEQLLSELSLEEQAALLEEI